MPPVNVVTTDNQRIRRAFSAASRSYEQSAVLQREVSARLLERLTEIGKPARRVLDIGAGTGTSIRNLQQHYPEAECVALDSALSMLLESGQRNTTAGTSAVCGDASTLPFADSIFDLVFSSLTMQWCSDLEVVFGEVRRVLAAKGLFLFTTLGPDTLYELRDSWAQVDSLVHVNRFSDMHDVGDALLRAGFADPVVDMERIVLTQPDVQTLLHDLKALGANTLFTGYRRGLTGRGMMQRMIKAYERFRRPEGDIPATFEVVYGLAWQADNERPLRFVSPDSFLSGRY